jgi:Tol biopolymer transport system component
MGANINTEWDEESVGLSPAGDQVMVYFDNTFYYGDIGAAPLKGKMWQKPVMYPLSINSKQVETGATMSIDGNTVYFSSDRKEGSGKSDIWMVKKENGQWGEPANMKELNSAFDETNPVLSLDGKTIYFASNGTESMGGYDILYSEWNESSSSWSKPVNLGYPLNDPDDNMFISFTGDNRFAYLTAVRPDGLGEKDIYQVEFLDTLHHPFAQLLTGTVSGSSGRTEITKIILEDKAGKQLVYLPTSANNNFAMPAAPGDYTLKVEGYNFVPYSEEISVGNEYPPVELHRTIQLTPSK